MSEIQITAFPRIHLGLLAMNPMAHRKNGGLGFAVSDPAIQVHAVPNEVIRLTDQRSKRLPPEELTLVHELLESARQTHRLPLGASISIQGGALSHHGLGAGTSVRLACIEGLFLANGISPAREELVRISGRGGASGIGINTYFEGGLIFDLGVRQDGQKSVPSDLNRINVPQPLVLARTDVPSWSLGICVPKHLQTLSIAEESAFFSRTIPVPLDEVFSATYHALLGVLAGAKDNDYQNFCNGVTEIQKRGWKKAERNIYGNVINELDDNLRSFGADTVAMSSLGPTLIFFSNDPSDVLRRARVHLANWDTFIVSPRNKGREVQHG